MKSNQKEREKPSTLRNILAFVAALPFLIGAIALLFWSYVPGSYGLL